MTSVSLVDVDSTDLYMRQLALIMAEFNNLVVRYCVQVQSPPYWFNERASLSLLAAAAWRQGWVGVEEFSTRKILAQRQDPNQPIDRHGRCDLYLCSPEGASFAIEAKQVVAKPADLEAVTRDALKRARNDARQLFVTEATCRVALAFVIPTLPATDAGQHAMAFDTWLKECLALVQGPRRINHAYVFPEVARDFLGPARRAFWPGVIVIAQRIHRRAKTGTLAAPDGLVPDI